MGWKFISQKQANEVSKATRAKTPEQDKVRFIVAPEPPVEAVPSKFGPSAIVNGVAAFLKQHTKGLSKQELAVLEAHLHATITKVLRSRD